MVRLCCGDTSVTACSLHMLDAILKALFMLHMRGGWGIVFSIRHTWFLFHFTSYDLSEKLE